MSEQDASAPRQITIEIKLLVLEEPVQIALHRDPGHIEIRCNNLDEVYGLIRDALMAAHTQSASKGNPMIEINPTGE